MHLRGSITTLTVLAATAFGAGTVFATPAYVPASEDSHYEQQYVAQAPISNGARLDDRYLNDPAVRSLVIPLGERLAGRISDEGSFRANSKGDLLDIANQRSAFPVVAAGVASRNDELIERGLRAVEWGLAQAGNDGAFPRNNSPKMLPRAFFLEAAAHSLLLLNGGSVGSATNARVIALKNRLSVAINWLSASRELTYAIDHGINTNQLMVAATAIQEAGVFLQQPRFIDRAYQIMQRALGRQTEEGVFPERGGFDVNYQAVSMEFLARYHDTLPPSEWKSQVQEALRRGVYRLTRAINSEGHVDTSRNTRTKACGSPTPGEARSSADSLPLRLFYLSHALNDQTLAALGRATARVGQSFDHIEQCRN